MNNKSFVNYDHPANAEILNYLNSNSALRVKGEATYDLDEYATNTHPDLVERFYQIGSYLAENCASVEYGYPVLAAPSSGVIFATATGTDTIGIRLPAEAIEEAITAGAQKVIVFRHLGEKLSSRSFGKDWVLFGAFSSTIKEEVIKQWLRTSCEYASAV
jgi:hypothetical protein